MDGPSTSLYNAKNMLANVTI